MLIKKMCVLLAATGILLTGSVAWADDDAMMDVDNHSASFTGGWGTSTAKILYYGDNYRYAWGCGDSCGTATATATFTTKNTADISGYYNVFVRHSTATNREETAYFKIYSVSGVTETYRGYCYINQTQDGGEWLYCNNVYLPTGSYGRIKLGNEYTGTNEVVIADGVRFIRTGVDGADILDSSVTGADLATGAVASIDILDSTITGADILNSTITGSDIASSSIYDYDIADEPGFDYTSWGSHTYVGISECGSYSNLTSVTLTAPTSGYIVVQANGAANSSVAGHAWRVCLDDASGGTTCDGYSWILEPANTNYYENEKSWSLQNVYYVSSAGSKTIYLKACRSEFANGTIMWNPVVATFYPTRY